MKKAVLALSTLLLAACRAPDSSPPRAAEQSTPAPSPSVDWDEGLELAGRYCYADRLLVAVDRCPIPEQDVEFFVDKASALGRARGFFPELLLERCFPSPDPVVLNCLKTEFCEEFRHE
jgi:hypothetical protein